MVVHIAIPAMNEAEFISRTMHALESQIITADMRVYVCVNQSEKYWEDVEKQFICEDNQKTLELLKQFDTLSLEILDFSSRGKGWGTKKFGVGIARKVLMDHISSVANKEDIVISLDADTFVNESYVQSVIDNLRKFPNAVAVSIPYYHPLTGSDAEDRAILRYEIYMRNYAIQMLIIDSPFAFTALGSAMAYRINAYRAIGGMSPMKSGEDFYFLQQMRKFGHLLISNSEMVYPAARFSDRVFFGTGPAMIKGDAGDWNSYPIYNHSQFQEVRKLYDAVPHLMDPNFEIDSVFYQFLQTQFKEDRFLDPIRKNSKDAKQFSRGFYTKVDGLRVLQFLKSAHATSEMSDRELLVDNFPQLKEIDVKYSKENQLVDFSTEDLALIRNILFDVENQLIMNKIILT